MATVINSDTQFTDESTGELINNGFIYIGLDGQDAKLNPAVIYSDRELTVVLANPQRTGADGRSVNKIWVDGKYSMKVENFENVQKLNRLSLGELTQTGNTILTNVQGADALTANASPTITELVDRQVYILTAAANNTTAMTLTIDLTPTWPIKKHHDLAMVANDTEANQTLAVIWNETDSVYEIMTNSAIAPVDVATAQTITGIKTFSNGIISDVTGDITANNLYQIKGADIASANDTVLLADGNDNDMTGSVTVNGMTDGIANEVRHIHVIGAPLFKHNTAASAGFSSLWIVQGAADIQGAAGDEFDERYDGTYWRIENYIFASNTVLKTKVIDIGDWDMDATTSVGVAHGLTLANIRGVSALIRKDNDLTYYDFSGANNPAQTLNHTLTVTGTNVALVRAVSGVFDSVDFDSTSFNRGWITIQYVP